MTHSVGVRRKIEKESHTGRERETERLSQSRYIKKVSKVKR